VSSSYLPQVRKDHLGRMRPTRRPSHARRRQIRPLPRSPEGSRRAGRLLGKTVPPLNSTPEIRSARSRPALRARAERLRGNAVGRLGPCRRPWRTAGTPVGTAPAFLTPPRRPYRLAAHRRGGGADRTAHPDKIAPSYVFFASERTSSHYSGEVLAPVGGETHPG